MNRKIISGAYSRRKFLYDLSMHAGMAAFAINGVGLLSSCEENTKGGVPNEKPDQMSGKNQKKLGVALVGLGGYAGGQLAPALQQTKNCYLAGIVTGTPSKAASWKSKYNLADA